MEPRRLAAPVALLLLCAAGAQPCLAWGFTAHRLVNRRAIATLPLELRALFEANADYIAEHATDADLRRLTSGDPDHFLDMDAFGPDPARSIPRDEAAHLAVHGPEAREKGRLPWRAGEAYRELVTAFTARDPARILANAAELGHFVGDAHVPLHAVLNYDGQLTGQNGLHNRWESELVERFEQQLAAELGPSVARRAGDPVGVVFDALLASFAAAPQVLESDRLCAGPRDLADTPEDDRYDDGYYSRLYAREGARLRARLSAGIGTLGSLWLSAWQDAGRPALPSFRFPYVRRGARAVVVSLDGAGAALVDDAVARGLMPTLARLRNEGASARGSLPALPTKTAASHAALYTGAWSDRNGIGGNDLSVPDASILEIGDGYSSEHLAAEPLWVTAARQGLEATVVSATQVFPFDPFLAGKRFERNYGWRLALFDGYQNLRAADAVHTAQDLRPQPASGWRPALPPHEGSPREFAIRLAAGARVDGLLYDDPGDPVRGLDTLRLTLDKDLAGAVTLKPVPARDDGDTSAFGNLSVRLAVGEAALFFRLFALAPDGAELLLYQSAPHVVRSSRPRLEGAALEATGGFLGNAPDGLYESGALGPPLWAGGDGTAERRYLETVALVVRQFSRLTSFGLERTSWDVLFTYLPYPDESLHLWLGRLDASLPGHDPALAERLRPFVDRVLALCDQYLDGIARRAGPRSVLAVVSDHGQVATDRVVRPNVALAAAGLLAANASGEVDLARTRAYYAHGGFVLVNRKSRPGGIVDAGQEDEVRRAAAAALTAVRDPEGGAMVILEALAADSAAQPARGGPTGGDLYLSLAPRYRASSALRAPVVEAVAPRGEHFANPERRGLQALLVLSGEGVAHGADLGEVRQIDLAPTLCALLGIDPPLHSAGEVLDRALARR